MPSNPTTGFHSRASGKLRRFGRCYPRGFARLKWQLFSKRLEAAKTMRAIDRVARAENDKP